MKDQEAGRKAAERYLASDYEDRNHYRLPYEDRPPDLRALFWIAVLVFLGSIGLALLFLLL